MSVQYVVLDVKEDSVLYEFMQVQPRWSVDFEDGESAVFARASVPQAEGSDC